MIFVRRDTAITVQATPIVTPLHMRAVIPLKAFDAAKARLSPTYDARVRAEIARATADHVVQTCSDAGFDTAIVTGDDAVTEWATRTGARVLADPGKGLDAACAAGAFGVAGPWVVVHGDLPLLDVPTMATARRALETGRSLIAPSRDGGTNLLGAATPISFSYGAGSFHRHLAALGADPVVLIALEAIIELDTPEDLAAAAALPGGAWLHRFLS